MKKKELAEWPFNLLWFILGVGIVVYLIYVMYQWTKD